MVVSMVAFPRSTSLEHLRWFFLVYASNGVLAPSSVLPKLPQQDIMARYHERVEHEKQVAAKQELELQKVHLEQVHVPPRPVPFPHMTLTQRLPRMSTPYPSIRVETQCLPTIVGLLAGTQVERYAAEDMVASMMAHPFLSNPEQEAADRQLPFKERMRKFEVLYASLLRRIECATRS